MTEQDFSRFGASTLLIRTMQDDYQVLLLLINSIRTLELVPIMIAAMLIMIFRLNHILFNILAVIFSVSLFSMIYFGAKVRPLFLKLQQSIDRISLLMKEKLTGARTIRAFNNQTKEEEKLREADNSALAAAVAANDRISFVSPLALILMNWAVVIIYYAGSIQIRQGIASISELLLVFSYVGAIASSLAVVPFLVNMFPQASISCARILELLDSESSAAAPAISQKTEGITKGGIEFRNVTFGYGGSNNVLTDISVSAEPGQIFAIIGATGSGKTTFVNLLGAYYERNQGEILIDGTDIREFNSEYLRSCISYATQKPMVWQDTVKNNLTAWNSDFSDADIRDACGDAVFSDVLDNLKDGLDTVMAQGGMNISGGQRQRMSLARTILKKADIYVFDDSFSALDAETEEKALRNIERRLKGKTVIMVSQKIATIQNADKILVLDGGKTAGCGRHEELMKSCSVYREIYKTQCYAKGGET